MADNSIGESDANSNSQFIRDSNDYASRVDFLRLAFDRGRLCNKWLQAEQQHISDVSVPRFNARVLHLSPFTRDFEGAFPQSRQYVRIAHCCESKGERVVADPSALAFESEAFDLVIVQHVLEFSENPQAVLKEAARVLRPKGKIVIYSINPVCIGSAIALFVRLFNKAGVWNRKTLPAVRLRDWLKFLDFRVQQMQYLGHALPFGVSLSNRYWSKLAAFVRRFNLPASGVFGLVAEKDLLGMTPINPSWKNVQWQPRFYSIKAAQASLRAPQPPNESQ